MAIRILCVRRDLRHDPSHRHLRFHVPTKNVLWPAVHVCINIAFFPHLHFRYGPWLLGVALKLLPQVDHDVRRVPRWQPAILHVVHGTDINRAQLSTDIRIDPGGYPDKCQSGVQHLLWHNHITGIEVRLW